MCQMENSPEVMAPKHWQVLWAAAVSSTINRKSKRADFIFLLLFSIL